MDLIGFSIGCRHCRETDGKRWQFEYEDEERILPLAGRTDFGLMRVVERMTLDLGHVCPFCGSAQLEIFDLDLNGQRVFDFDQLCQRVVPQGLAVCALTIEKVASQPKVQLVVEPPETDLGFLIGALDEMAAQVHERSAYDFAAEASGAFYFCVGGHWESDAAKRWFSPQKYTCRSLTQEEVLATIKVVRANLAAG